MKRDLLTLAAALALSLLMAADALGQQLAFPTAEGFGRFSKGGRGGAVYIVSNANDSGAGSFRACAEAAGPRTCVFTFSGDIPTLTRIVIDDPFITVAGQTSPGGINLTNQGGSNTNQPLVIRTNNVILRHFRIRPGAAPTTSDNVDAINIETCSNDIIMDHLSFSWGTDETFNWTGGGGTSANGTLAAGLPCNVRDGTLQWSLVYENLRNSNHTSSNHSRLLYLGYSSGDFTWVRNAAGSSTRRLPNLGMTGQTDWVNSVVYGAGQYFGEIYDRHGDTHVNWIGNVAKYAPFSPGDRGRHMVDYFNNGGESDFDIFLDGNIDVNRPADTGDDRLVMDPKDWPHVAPALTGYGALSVSTVTSAEQAYWDVLDFGGAGGNIGKRDAADARWVLNVRNCTGAIIDTIAQGGGLPALSGGAAPTDADADGMADAWEAARGLSSSNAADRNGDLDGDGYTNLEEYLNELAGDQDASGVLINRIGTGTGAAINPTCGRTLSAINQPVITNFTVQGPNPWPAVKPGDTITITYDGDRKGGSCKSGGYVLAGGPTVCTGSATIIAPALGSINALSYDFILTGSNGLVDHQNRILFNTATGAMPTVTPAITCTPTTVNLGDSVNCRWLVNTARSAVASECVAFGPGFAGIKTVAEQETFVPLASGNYGVTCSGLAGSGTAQVALTVNGTPPPPPPATPVLTIAALDAVKAEGNSGATAFTFTVARTVSTAGASSASYGVSGNTASPATASDFASGALPSGMVSFAGGEASKTITVSVAGDTANEANEGFAVTLSAPVGAALGSPNVANGTINNDDTPPPPPVLNLAAAAATVGEGNVGFTAAGLTVTRTGDLTGGSTVTFAVSAGAAPAASATDFKDDVFASGPLTFLAGQATASIDVMVKADPDNEPDENFVVTISGATGATIGTATAGVTIVNDDPVTPLPPTFQEGANVEVNRSPYTSVHSAAGGSVLGNQPIGTNGTIVGCPRTQDGQVWWKVNFVTGRDGWVEQRYLAICAGVCP